MIEVINKADLLADVLGSADQKCLEQEPAASEAGAEKAVGSTRGADRHLCEEGASSAAPQDICNHQICDRASKAESLSFRAADREETGSHGSLPSYTLDAESSRSAPLLVRAETSEGGSAGPPNWGYDGQPRNVNANVEWLREQRIRRSSPPTVLTSTLTGQGLRDLTQEIEHMLRRRQGRGDPAEQVSLPGREQKHGSPQTHKSHDILEQSLRANADDAHVRELVGRAA